MPSIIFGISRILMSEQASASFLNQALKGVPQDWQRQLLKKYQTVSKDDVIAALRNYFLPLFDASSSVAVVVTAPSKSQEIGNDLAAAGFLVEQRTVDAEPADSDESGSESGSEDGSEDDESD